MTDKQNIFSVTSLALLGSYFGLTIARSSGWISDSWSLLPVVETAWLNFLVVLALVLWMIIERIPLSRVGLVVFQPSRKLFFWVAVTIVVDSVAVGIALPVLTSVFGEGPSVTRFAELPGNLSLLLMLLPAVWLIAALGEEFFFRGFLMTAIAEVLGGSRAAWILAVIAQAVAFGLVHAYQGPAHAISIGIGGAVYGAAVLMTKRNLWPVILAHGINDTLGFILVYSGVIQQ